MKIIPTLIAITALPLMALGQTADQQKDVEQGQTKESQEKTPAKKKKAHAAHEPNEGERAGVQVAAPRSVQAWAASERVLRPALRGEPFPVDREQLLRLCRQLLGRG